MVYLVFSVALRASRVGGCELDVGMCFVDLVDLVGSAVHFGFFEFMFGVGWIAYFFCF